jgi:hypothetical protein
MGMNTINDISPLAAFTQVGHALFARDGVKLAFGRRWDGEVIHISQATRGLACGCECPANNCRRRLIAHKPESNIAHHFAHAPLTPAELSAGIAPNCQYGAMTALHAYAEKFLNETKRLVLPPVEARVGERSQTLRGAKEFTFDSAKLETMDGETIPDVTLIKSGHRMHVEIFVTHRCGPEKRGKIAAANISAMEIDLSGLPRDVTFELLHREIQETAPRQWIYNKREEELRKTLEVKAKADAERLERQQQRKIADLKAAYAASHQRALACDWNNGDDVQKIVEAGDVDLLDGPSDGAGYFVVHPKVWKAAILNVLHTHLGIAGAASIIAAFRRHLWLADFYRTLKCNDHSLLAEAGLPAGPEEIVLGFLRHLAKQDVAEDQGWKWTYTRRHLDTLDQRKSERQRIAYEAAERASRYTRLTAIVNEIISVAGIDEGATFDLNAWRANLIEGMGQTPWKITDEGGPEWGKLTKGLSTTLAALRDESEDSAGDCGLPICEALQAATRRQAARAEALRLQAEEAAMLDRQARVDEIEHTFRAALGDADLQWLNGPASELNGLSPRAAAAQSFDLLARANRFLQEHVTDLKLKAQALTYLREKLMSLMKKDEERIELCLRGSHPRLPGRLSPNAYVKDQATADECLSHFKKPGRKR